MDEKTQILNGATEKSNDMVRNLLIIDDDKELVSALSEFLPKFNFKVYLAHVPSEGLKILESNPIDLIILDVMLPEKDGFQVCRQIREKSDVPVIMLTARGDITERIVGLEIGADDYMSKPFEPRELVARLEAILRRPRSMKRGKVLQFKHLEIDIQRHTAKAHGEKLQLTAMEFEILVLLASKPGVLFSRDDIMDHLRGAEYNCYSRTIDVMLSRIRSKLKDDPKEPSFIKTVWGGGYIFVGSQDEAA